MARLDIIHPMKRNAAFLHLLFCVLLLGASGCVAMAGLDTHWRQQCVVEDARLHELSGLAESIRYPGYFWAINDSGDSLRVFLLSPTGSTVAVVRLQGAGAIDTESLRVAGTAQKSWVYIGDTGDNRAQRPQVEIDRFAEPEIDVQQSNQDIALPCEQMILKYGDGKATDAETLLVDQKGYIGIVTKSFLGSKLWITPQPFSVTSQTLKLACEVPVKDWREGNGKYSLLFTDGALSNDGKHLALMTYTHFFIWPTAGDDLNSLAKVLLQRPKVLGKLPPLQQPESLTFAGNDQRLAVSSEGKNPPIMMSENGFDVAD